MSLPCDFGAHALHRPPYTTLGHFRGMLWIMAYAQCRKCGRSWSARWATTRRELNSFREPKREVLRWHGDRLAKQVALAASSPSTPKETP